MTLKDGFTQIRADSELNRNIGGPLQVLLGGSLTGGIKIINIVAGVVSLQKLRLMKEP